LFVFLLSIVSAAFSQEFEKTEPVTESWYTYWGLGYASISYPTELQLILDYLKEQDGVSNTSLCLDMLGFYLHVNPNTIGGVIINGAADRYEINGSSMQINQYIYGASVINYPGETFGSGFFIRADVGLAKLVVQSSETSDASSESGWGVLAGGGWSFDLGGTRLLLNANYAYRSVESESYSTLGFSIGGLF